MTSAAGSEADDEDEVLARASQRAPVEPGLERFDGPSDVRAEDGLIEVGDDRGEHASTSLGVEHLSPAETASIVEEAVETFLARYGSEELVPRPISPISPV